MSHAEAQPSWSGGGRFWLAVAVAVVSVVAYAAWIAFRVGGAHTTLVVDDAGNLVAPALAAVAILRRARASADLAWALVAVWLLLIGLGNLDRAYYEVVLGTDAPFPSPAFVSYFGSTVAQVLAMVLICGRGLGRVRPRLLLDGAIVAAALLLVSWFGVLQVVYDAGGGPFNLALALSRPIGDVVTAVVIVSTLSYSRHLDRARLVVVLGVLMFVCSDSVFAYLTAVGAPRGAAPVDAFWFSGFLAVGLASLIQSGPASMDAKPPARWQAAIPYIPLVAAIGLAMEEWLARRPLDVFTVLLLVVMVVLVLVRQFSAVVETQALAAKLDETAELWKETSAQQEVLIENAPVGICRLSPEGRLLTANRNLEQILRRVRDEIVGLPLGDLLAPEDRAALGVFTGGNAPLAGEARFLRNDDTVTWCSYAVVGVADDAGRPQSFIGIIEDVNERRLEAERAAAIQRQLLPQGTPVLDGYDLAGVCLPAQNVAGDFYDWVIDDGHLDVTVADVMGKGMGAALVMAALRTALRAAPHELGPARRITLAAESMVLGLDGLFVTVFQARLDLPTGRLRYVDAGHGHCAVRRADGELVHLATRSLPLGVALGAEFSEGEVRLEPGDSLLLYSDGLVETETGTPLAESLVPQLEGATDAAGMLLRLTGRVPPRLADDVTVVVLHRRPARPSPVHAFEPAAQLESSGRTKVP
jgi:PAS domain S-box-containing protein